MEEDCTLGNHETGVYGWKKAKHEIVPKIGEGLLRILFQTLKGSSLDYRKFTLQ